MQRRACKMFCSRLKRTLRTWYTHCNTPLNFLSPFPFIISFLLLTHFSEPCCPNCAPLDVIQSSSVAPPGRCATRSGAIRMRVSKPLSRRCFLACRVRRFSTTLVSYAGGWGAENMVYTKYFSFCFASLLIGYKFTKKTGYNGS